MIGIHGPGRLPSLRKFSYESSRTVHARALSSFLRAHGVKLHILSATSYANIPQLLNLCPNIVELNLLDERLPVRRRRLIVP